MLLCEEEVGWKAVKGGIVEARRRKRGILDEKCE
jgi:hypothetical protein